MLRLETIDMNRDTYRVNFGKKLNLTIVGMLTAVVIPDARTQSGWYI
jgi:hypothetical protein